MKAVILAAGLGSRLEEFTQNSPKTLLRVKGKPILEYIFLALEECNINEVVIIAGYKSSKIKDFVSQFSDNFNVKIIHNERYRETNNIYSLYLAENEVNGRDFVIINSDVLFHPKILSYLINSEKRGVVLSVDLEAQLGDEEMKVKIDDGKIVEISKEIPAENADGEYIGIARIDARTTLEFFNILKETISIEGENVFYESAFQRMIEKGKAIFFESTRGLPWIEIDTKDDLKKAEDVVLKCIES